MTNGEKYKTADERHKAFVDMCRSHSCSDCKIYSTVAKLYDGPTVSCAFMWLELEAEEEKPLPCPFCRGKTHIVTEVGDDYCPRRSVVCEACEYSSKAYLSRDEAIAEHNRVARAVMEAKESEEAKK